MAMRDLVLFPDMTTPVYAMRPKSLAVKVVRVEGVSSSAFMGSRGCQGDGTQHTPRLPTLEGLSGNPTAPAQGCTG